MKRFFKMKEILNIPWNFQPIWSCFERIIVQLYSRTCFWCHYWILQKTELLLNCQSFLRWICKTSKTCFLQAFALKERYERASSLTGRNYVTELSTFVNVTRKCRRKGTFNLTKIENNHEFRRQKVCHTKSFIFVFSLELHIQF